MAPISRSEFKQQMQEMDPAQFEHFVADIWSAQGWNTRVTQEQGDRGIDIVATKDSPVSEKHLIQAKRYSPDNPVGSPDVQQYASLRQQEQAVDAVVIVTSGQFSKQAERVARDLNVKLIDGDELYEIVSSHDLSAVVADYLEPLESTQEIEQTQSQPPQTVKKESESHKLSKRMIGVFTSVLLVVIVLAGGVVFLSGTGMDLGTTIGESVTHNGLRITVSNCTFAHQLNNTEPEYTPGPATPPDGAKFLLVHVKIKNVGNIQRGISGPVQLFYYGKDHGPLSYESFTVSDERFNGFPEDSPDIYPGKTVEGWVVYEVPRDFNSEKAVIQVGIDETLQWEFEQSGCSPVGNQS